MPGKKFVKLVGAKLVAEEVKDEPKTPTGANNNPEATTKKEEPIPGDVIRDRTENLPQIGAGPFVFLEAAPMDHITDVENDEEALMLGEDTIGVFQDPPTLDRPGHAGPNCWSTEGGSDPVASAAPS